MLIIIFSDIKVFGCLIIYFINLDSLMVPSVSFKHSSQKPDTPEGPSPVWLDLKSKENSQEQMAPS